MMYVCPSFRPTIYKMFYDATSIQVIIGPMEKNFGVSFANMLRRIIIRYTPGMGIIGIKINNLHNIHPYTTIPGLRENISELLNNCKMILLSASNTKTTSLILKKKGPSIIRARDLQCPSNVVIYNKDLYICSLEFNAELNIELFAEYGCGYVPANYHGSLNNILYCDTNFSPIRHISYYVRSYTIYEEIIFYVKTNIGYDPLFALENGFNFLNNKTNVFYVR